MGHFDDALSLRGNGLTATGLAPSGVQVAWQQMRAGRVELAAANEHRIRIHSGAPLAGYCGVARFVYTSGDLDLMPAGYADAWNEDADSTSLFLGVAPALLHRTAEDIGLDPSRVRLDLQHQFRDPQIEHIAWALEAEHRSEHAHGRLYTDSLGLALSVHLLRRYASPHELDGGLPPTKLRRLKDYIEAHLDQDLALVELAAVVGLSSSHLKTLFRRSTGMPVHQYLLRQRVEHARRLLESSDRPISQIALDAGFAHQSHLARCMRRMIGVTPAMLRRRRTSGF
jgi:AraC family transcriptional regulator